MITKNEALNIIAAKHGLSSWMYASMIKETIELEEIIYAAMDLYAEQSNSHKPVVGGPASASALEGEQLGNEAGATKPVRRFENCYIRNKIGCHCTDECGYEAVMRGTP